MARHRLSEIDRRVLDTLTRRVRVADAAQLADVCVADDCIADIGVADVERRLARLRNRGWLQSGTVTVRRPKLITSLWNWQPGDATPSAGPLAWQLQKRWKPLSPQLTTVWWGTEQAAKLMGGVGGRLRQPLQVAHDLGVTDVYRGYLADDEREGEWMGEDNYRREFRPSRNVKVPDAVLLDAKGDIAQVFEFGGAYPADRVRAFHRFWSRRQIPYEVW